MSLLNIKTSLVNNSSRSTVGTEVRNLLNELQLRSTNFENVAFTTDNLTDLQKIS
jgi:hypothetical protein